VSDKNLTDQGSLICYRLANSAPSQRNTGKRSAGGPGFAAVLVIALGLIVGIIFLLH
jgi:hypothetical protein